MVFCFLAYGEEHINEFNTVVKMLWKIDSNYKVVVATDSPKDIIEGVYKVVEIKEEFNYNLKRVALAAALKESNTVVFLDTDTFLRTGINFSELDNLENGMYAAEIVNLDSLKDVYGSLDYMKDYLKELTKVYTDELFLVHEGYFVLKIEDKEQKKSFIEYWEDIDKQTRPHQRLAYDLPGAMEGIIMWIALQKAKIDVKLTDERVAKVFDRLSHFGKRYCKLERTII